MSEQRTRWPEEVVRPRLLTAKDVRAWFEALTEAGISFHPEESFEDVVEFSSGLRSFRPDEARSMDAAMVAAYRLCDDPCEVALAVMGSVA